MQPFALGKCVPSKLVNFKQTSLLSRTLSSRFTPICSAHRRPEWRAAEVQESKLAKMQEYVDTVELNMAKGFIDKAPTCVVDAIRTTVRGITGMLPPQFFEVNVRCQSTSLEQLLLTHLLHGFMFKNAMIRLDLKASLALPSAAEGSASSLMCAARQQANKLQSEQYAPGTQLTNVHGNVLKWHNDLGTESVPAQQYIQQLEAEILNLKQQQQQADQKPPWVPAGQENMLLKEIQELGAGAAALTQDADSDVQAAFRSFVDRQLGPNYAENGSLPICSAEELAYLLFCTMAVGYNLCSMHVSHGIASSLDIADQGIY